MSNHFHAVVRPRPARAGRMSDAAVARAWWCVRNDLDPGETEEGPDPRQLERLVNDGSFISRWRERFGSLSWFMKELKEPFSRMVNRAEDNRGAFWDGRFKSVPLLDRAAIVACSVYVDLNPIRACLAGTPEKSEYTSVRTRLETRTMAISSRDVWLTPVKTLTSTRAGDPGLTLASYLRLVDVTGRMARADKPGSIPSELPRILARLAGEEPIQVAGWLASVTRPFGLRGSVLGGATARAAEANRRGVRWVQVRSALFTKPG